jgi:hypothetical protein
MGGKVYSWGNGNGTPSPIMEGIDLLACSAYHTVGAGTIHEERECVCVVTASEKTDRRISTCCLPEEHIEAKT